MTKTARSWSANLQPLADAFVEKYLAFLPKQNYPIRTGVHPNTAFGLAFALDYARALGNKKLESLDCRTQPHLLWPRRELSRRLGAGRRRLLFTGVDGSRPDAPGHEQGGVCALVSSISSGYRSASTKGNLLQPAIVTDRTDPKLVHLDGLNLSRAWCMRSIAAALPRNDPARQVLARSAAAHAQAALPHVTSGNYEGEHWLASFAVYMLTAPTP